MRGLTFSCHLTSHHFSSHIVQLLAADCIFQYHIKPPKDQKGQTDAWHVTLEVLWTPDIRSIHFSYLVNPPSSPFLLQSLGMKSFLSWPLSVMALFFFVKASPCFWVLEIITNMYLAQRLSHYFSQTLGGLENLPRGLRGQIYFHNNTKTFFTYFSGLTSALMVWKQWWVNCWHLSMNQAGDMKLY